jgi:CSLREA domain-containing protein
MSHRSLARLAPLMFLFALAVLLAGDAAPALGASFTVNATHDAVDASPGDGVCADAGGACTLRAAVMEANALAGADEISLPAGTYVLSIPGAGEDASATGDLDVTDDVAITAPVIVNGASEPGATVDGAGLDRVFHIIGGTVHISGQTIRNGSADGEFTIGGLCEFALYGGGGVCVTSGTLDLADAALVENISDGHGGGIVNGSNGRLNITNTIMTGNMSRLAGGALFNAGAGEMLDALLQGNVAGTDGGGIASVEDRANPGASIATASSVISDNAAGNSGGGISNSSGVLTISESVIAGNRATFAGGLGSEGGGLGGPANLVLTSSTVAENTARDSGGGIIADNGAITNSTISGNRAGRTGGVLGGGGSLSIASTTITANNAQGMAGGLASLGGVTLSNAIVGRNLGSSDCSGGVASLGHNLDSDGSCALSGPGDLSNTDPLLLPLGDNGGPTQTHALMQGGCPTDACIVPSPAIDAGDSGCPSTDQRGEPRPFDGNGDGTGVCDIGAYEVQEPPLTCSGPCGPVPLTPTPTATAAAPATATPTSTAATLPITLPATGGDGGSEKAMPVAVASVAAIVATSVVWRVRRWRR